MPMEVRGTALWVSEGSASRATVEAAARAFEMAVAFCTPADVFAQLALGRYEVVGIELGVEPALPLVRAVRARAATAAIFAAAADTSVEAMRATFEAGASDFLSLPLAPAELHKALLRAMRASAAPSAGTSGEVIAVCAGRGGLGATTLAVNLAVALVAQSGQSVGLLDLDLQRGDVAAFLNLTPGQTLASLVAMREGLDELFLLTAMTRHASGVLVLPAPAQIEESDALGHDDLAAALRLVRSQFRWTVVDTARTVTAATLAAFEYADRILLLSDLTVPGVRAARRAFELLGRLDAATRTEIVLTERVPGPVERADATRAIGKAPFFTLPRDEAAAASAMNDGVPLNGRPGGLALAVRQLAAKLAGVAPETSLSRGHLLRRFFGKEAHA
jgi:pilus assembly protein CpaE